MPSGWRNNRYTSQQVTYLHGEEELEVNYSFKEEQHFSFQLGDSDYEVDLIQAENAGLHFQVDKVQYQATIVSAGNQFFFQGRSHPKME